MKLMPLATMDKCSNDPTNWQRKLLIGVQASSPVATYMLVPYIGRPDA